MSSINIDWTRQMERAELTLFMVFVRWKSTVKRPGSGVWKGTPAALCACFHGNYNTTTARIYTDLGL